MLTPFVGPDGKFIETPDELLLLLKRVKYRKFRRNVEVFRAHYGRCKCVNRTSSFFFTTQFKTFRTYLCDSTYFSCLNYCIKKSFHQNWIPLNHEVPIISIQGLDFRLQEFEEDCRRLQKTERRLQRMIDQCTLSFETSLVEAKGYADTRLVEQVNEQQRLIEWAFYPEHLFIETNLLVPTTEQKLMHD